MAQLIWGGTQAEYSELTRAVMRWCECEYGVDGAQTSNCGVHALYDGDQKWRDHLVFLRRLGYDRLELEPATDDTEVWRVPD